VEPTVETPEIATTDAPEVDATVEPTVETPEIATIEEPLVKEIESDDSEPTKE